MKVQEEALPEPEQRHTSPENEIHFDLSHLDVFVGRWRLDGKQLEGPFGPPMLVQGLLTVDWLLGRRFQLMKLEGVLGPNAMGCAEITGESPNGHGYRVQAFYNDGVRREWKLGERDGVWIRTSEDQADGVALRTRCLTTFSPGGDMQTSSWEYSRDAESWTPFWETTCSRTG